MAHEASLCWVCGGHTDHAVAYWARNCGSAATSVDVLQVGLGGGGASVLRACTELRPRGPGRCPLPRRQGPVEAARCGGCGGKEGLEDAACPSRGRLPPPHSPLPPHEQLCCCPHPVHHVRHPPTPKHGTPPLPMLHARTRTHAHPRTAPAPPTRTHAHSRPLQGVIEKAVIMGMAPGVSSSSSSGEGVNKASHSLSELVGSSGAVAAAGASRGRGDGRAGRGGGWRRRRARAGHGRGAVAKALAQVQRSCGATRGQRGACLPGVQGVRSAPLLAQLPSARPLAPSAPLRRVSPPEPRT